MGIKRTRAALQGLLSFSFSGLEGLDWFRSSLRDLFLAVCANVMSTMLPFEACERFQNFTPICRTYCVL